MLRNLFAAATCSFAFVAAPTFAQDVRFIVPYAAGGPMDQIARVIAPALTEALGQTVIVDNRAGAGGMVGTNVLAMSEPDGNTVILSSQGSHILTSLTQVENLPYDPVESFTPIALIGILPAVLTVRADFPANNLEELIAYAETNDLTFGSSGVGNSPHLAGELLNRAAGLSIRHVPYGGVGPVMVDILAGNVDMVVADIPVVVPQVAGGGMKAIATFGAERAAVLPDVPTGVEQGYPDLITGNYYFILGPAGMDEETRSRLEQAFLTAVTDPEVAATLAAAGLGASADGEVLAEHITTELERWGPFVEDLELVNR